MVSTWVYIAGNSVGQLHIGTSENLIATMKSFKERKVIPVGWFHGVDDLLYVREFDNLRDAERYRATLVKLSPRTQRAVIRTENPMLLDLSRPWFSVTKDATEDARFLETTIWSKAVVELYEGLPVR